MLRLLSFVIQIKGLGKSLAYVNVSRLYGEHPIGRHMLVRQLVDVLAGYNKSRNRFVPLAQNFLSYLDKRLTLSAVGNWLIDLQI
jgi:hypothetical protein